MTVCFCTPFSIKIDEIKEFQTQKVEVESENVIGTQHILNVEIVKSEYEAATENMQKEMDEIESIDNKKEWFIAYKNIIDKYSYIIDPTETIYDCFSEDELDLLFHVVQAEVGDKYLFEQKVNVANVIFNRLYHDRFPDEIFNILTPDQFQPISDGRYKKVEVSNDTVLACEYAFIFPDTTNGSLFFDSNNTLKYEFVMNDGAHNFYKLRGENKNE